MAQGARTLVALFALAASLSCSADGGTTPGGGDGGGGGVGSGAVSAVRLNPATAELGLGSTLRLGLTAVDAQDNEVAGRSTVWASADTGVANVSQDGTVTARRIGVVQIQAVVDGKSAVALVSVVAARVASVAITPSGGSVAAGSSLQLTAATTDAGGFPLSDRLVFWQSSNNAVALVTSTGLVSGRTAGTATITATSEGKSATAQVTVTGTTPPVTPPVTPPGGGATPAAVDSVKVEPADTTMVRNTSARFRARVFVGKQTVTGRAVTWSTTTPNILTVDAGTGDVTTQNRPNSTGFVNATVEGKVGSATVKVTNKAARAVSVDGERSSLQVGESMTVSASVVDVDNVALPTSLAAWKSGDPAVLAVTSTGGTTARVTAMSAGSTSVTATAEGVSGGMPVVVTAPPAPVVTTTHVDVEPKARSLVAGETQQLTAAAFDGAGARREGRTFAWRSSNPAVATVGATSGLVTAVGAGTATVIASTDGVEGSAGITVTVPPPPIVTQRVEVSPASGAFLPGATQQLTAAAFDNTGARREGRTFAWTSSDASVATVNASTGLVTAVKPGTTTITATADGVSGSTTVTVDAPPRASVARVAVTPPSATLDVGGTVTLSAAPFAADGTQLTDRPAAGWASSDARVATVSAGGVVSAVGAGTATITATIEGTSGTATITVNVPAPARVDVAPATSTVAIGQTATLAATPFDAAGARLDGRPAASWSSSDAAVATVSAAGVVTAVAAGTATITATIQGVSGTATVTVPAPPSGPTSVARVTVAPAAVTLSESGSDAARETVLTAELFGPAGEPLTGRRCSWDGGKRADGRGQPVATIESTTATTARIRGMSVGTTSIIATCEGQAGSAAVTVVAGR